MLDIKPYGAFIENTIRPLLEEVRQLLDIAKSNGLDLTERNIARVVKSTGQWYLLNSLLESFRNILITMIVCYTAWMICKWTT